MTKQKYLFILSFVSCLSFSEEHALDLYSMKKFCSDKMVKLMTPSQKRQGSFVYALTFFFPLFLLFFTLKHTEVLVLLLLSVTQQSVMSEGYTQGHTWEEIPLCNLDILILLQLPFSVKYLHFTLWYFLFYIILKDTACHPSCTCEKFSFFPMMFSALSFSFPYVLPSLLTIETLFGRWVIVKLWKWQHKYSALICCWNNTKKLFLATL